MDRFEEAEEIIAELEKRKKYYPRDFFIPFPYQKKFRDYKSPINVKGIFGGNRSGKTEEGAEYVVGRCEEKPRQRWWAVAETEEVSINVQQRKIYDLLPKLDMKYCHYDEVNGFRNAKVIYKNNSMIRFKTYMQGRETFASDDVDGIWDDEEPPIEIFKEQKMRLLDRGGEMIFTMTSLKGITDLMRELFEDHDVIESEMASLVGEELPRVVDKNGARFFMLWTTENPFISQPMIADNVKMMTRAEIKSRIYGIPMNLSGRIYPNFSKDVHVVSVDRIPKRQITLWHVLDPHDRKPWAMQWWVVDRTGTAWCVREYPWRRNFNDMEFDDKTYDDYADVIKETERQLLSEYGRSVSRRIIDPNFGNKTVQLAKRVQNNAHTTPVKELKARGLVYQDGIDALEAGHLQVRKWLHYEEKNKEIIVQPKLLVSVECENTIRHLSRYSRKDIQTTDGDTKDSVAPMDKYKDFSDTTRYGVMAGMRYIERYKPEQEPVKRAY